MKTLRLLVLGSVVAITPAWSASSRISSDLVSSHKRQESVDRAVKLTRPPVPTPPPADLTQPFNPAGFDAPDPDEQKANAAAGIKPVAGTAVQQPVGPTSDRELLETIAPRIQPTGSVVMGGKPLLSFPDAKRVRVGDVIQVKYNDREYDLEVTAIDRTNFTLRYRGEETTRPIAKSTK